MESFILFLYKSGRFLVFFILQAICVWLIVTRNSEQRAAFMEITDEYAGRIYSFTENVDAYFRLKETNRELAEENARLHKQLEVRNAALEYISFDRTDSSLLNRFEFIPAKVVNNSVYGTGNYITINKGALDGIKRGMGVVSPSGVVGKVKSTSKHFSVLYSLLHTDMLTSCRIGNSDLTGAVKWNGDDPNTLSLVYIPKHARFEKGDTVFTSDLNAVFPRSLPVGIIKENTIIKGENSIPLKPAVRFDRLSYVYVIKNELKSEQDSLENSAERVK